MLFFHPLNLEITQNWTHWGHLMMMVFTNTSLSLDHHNGFGLWGDVTLAVLS